ncbi:MAG: MGMT family protein [Treponema sp.]|jgi:methylated-DNA-protein-cysteine methyltransferase-like protein|nr:MGMT family protein [Treponema sp.]
MTKPYKPKPYTAETLRIIEAVQAVPAGRVSSYRDIAGATGLPQGARQVARILHALSRSQNLPWHRIIKANGRIALRPGQGQELQIQLLRSEGVAVTDEGAVAMDRYGNIPDVRKNRREAAKRLGETAYGSDAKHPPGAPKES